MQKLLSLLMVGILLICPSVASARLEPNDWSSPTVIISSWWEAPSIDGQAVRAVFLDPYTTSGTGAYADFYYDRRILLSEFSNGSWSQPVAIGSNAMYRPTGLMPVITRPVISADGYTLAYLGCRGGCQPFSENDSYDIFISRRTEVGWSAPTPLYIAIGAIGERISLSEDGNTLAFSSNYLNLPFYKFNQVYVTEFSAGAWGAPAPISSDTINGWSPDLSRDGLQAVWLSNPPAVGGQNILMIANRSSGGAWSAPQPLEVGIDASSEVGLYRFSPDGNRVFYWKMLMSTVGESTVCSGQDLYVLHRTSEDWSTPQRVTSTSIVPMACNGEAPPATDDSGSRVIYPRTVMQGDAITATFLEMTEYRQGSWSEPAAITSPYFPYFAHPNLSSDGARLITLGPDYSTGNAALVLMTSTPMLGRQIFLPLTLKTW